MTNLQRLINIIEKAFRTGGATLQTGQNNFLNEVTYVRGYQVAGFSKVIKLKISDFINRTVNHDGGAALYDDIIGLKETNRGYNIELWYDEAASVLEIEASKRIISKKEALKVASELNQKAIYDWANQKSITL
jgi:hypothetical protein